MRLEVKIALLEFGFKFCTFHFLLTGVGLCILGVLMVFVKVTLLHVLPSEEWQMVGVGLVLISGLVVVLSIVGCIGAEKGKRVVLLVFLGFIIIVFLGQLFITLLLLISREKIGQTLDQSTDQIIRRYGDGSGDNRLMDSDSQDRLMDKIQTYDECCGRTGPADWLKNSYIRTLNLTEPDVLPCSCFRSFKRSGNSPWCSELQNFTAPLYGRANGTFEEGCKTKINDWLQKNTLFIVSMDVSGLLIEVVVIIITVYLYRFLGVDLALEKDDDFVDEPEIAMEYGEFNNAFTADDGYIDPDHPAHHYDDPQSGVPIHMTYHHDNRNY